MSYSYTNRFRKVYVLVEGKTSAGKSKLYFSQKKKKRQSSQTEADHLPEGYEVFEDARGQVYLRKEGSSLVPPEEVALAAKALKKFKLEKQFEPWVDKNTLTIYEISQGAMEMVREFNPWLSRETLEDMCMTMGQRTAMMRFVLEDKEKRVFSPERFCFRGSVDRWISIGAPGKLPALFEKYFGYLGKDSLFELF